ncbi:MAG: peptidase M15 [Muribaculaceae bacterium]|nr:peptidase M15 [Muribaculaceae bacterium]
MQLTKNFNLEELTASATAKIRKISNIPNDLQISRLKKLCESILQPLRDKLGLPIKVTSGFRNPSLNKAVRGSAYSQHLKGEAADIVCSNNKVLWDLICSMILTEEITVGQAIDEHNLKWIHIFLPDIKHHNQILHIKGT